MHTLPGVFCIIFVSTGMSSVVRLADIVPGNYRRERLILPQPSGSSHLPLPGLRYPRNSGKIAHG
jgi:hypothetical protein